MIDNNAANAADGKGASPDADIEDMLKPATNGAGTKDDA